MTLLVQIAGMFEKLEKALPRVKIDLPALDRWPDMVFSLGPLPLLFLFMASSLIMIWRLNAVEEKGFEGTMVGTIVMPFCSGFANLAFALVMAGSKDGGSLVLENCIVNNVTNLTLVLGIPTLFWGINIAGRKKVPPKKENKKAAAKEKEKEKRTEAKISYFSLLLSLIAMLFFTGAVWQLARDGILDASDGMVLTGLFLFWQAFHVVDVMKNNVRKSRTVDPSVIGDFVAVGLCAWVTVYSIDGLVVWVTEQGSGFLSRENLGLLSGLLMVVPNAMLAFYYSAKGRSDIAYSSQIGDCHICIPLCIGVYAIASPITVPATFELGAGIIMVTGGVLLLFTALLGRLPRIMGAVLTLSYSVFLYRGIIS
ncbi:MAG: hypothetical protein JEZ12_06900 [Desulfobacterium sp.]|nr:hypothetical protein [Desulfobacterium sp.]